MLGRTKFIVASPNGDVSEVMNREQAARHIQSLLEDEGVDKGDIGLFVETGAFEITEKEVVKVLQVRITASRFDGGRTKVAAY